MSENIKQPKGLSSIEQHILNTISQIKYGSVEILIHDSRVVQIERSEKVRFNDTKQVTA